MKHRKHYLLSAEGVFYFILAGVDVLAHVLPGPRRSLTTFMGLDIFIGKFVERNFQYLRTSHYFWNIGALSFLPIAMYTVFLFLLTTKDVLPGFPQRLQVLTKYILLGFIPLIVLMNELASFLGISYRSFILCHNHNLSTDWRIYPYYNWYVP